MGCSRIGGHSQYCFASGVKSRVELFRVFGRWVCIPGPDKYVKSPISEALGHYLTYLCGPHSHPTP